MRTTIAMILTLILGVAGWLVVGLGTTDDGPKGDRLVGMGWLMIGCATAFAITGVIVALVSP
jgi:hypothetical protein